jgi:hypothetical protein
MSAKTQSALIWQWFEKGDFKGLDGQGFEIHYYRCKVCLEHLKPDKLAKYNGITATTNMNSNLHKHLNIQCIHHQNAKKELDEQEKKQSSIHLEARKRKADEDVFSTPTSKRTLFDMNAVVKKAKYSKNNPMQIGRFRQLLIMIVKCMLPISLIEREGFRDFIEYLG